MKAIKVKKNQPIDAVDLLQHHGFIEDQQPQPASTLCAAHACPKCLEAYHRIPVDKESLHPSHAEAIIREWRDRGILQ